MPDTAPLVSFIMPARNHAAFVGSALCSILAQTHPRIELIVIDDGSQDDTPNEIARVLAANRRDMRIEFHRQENRGLARTLLRGLDLARGEFVQFLASDDALFPDMTARLVAAYAGAGPQVVAIGCDGYVFDGRRRGHLAFSQLHPAPVSRNLHRELLVGNWFPAMGLLYRRDLMLREGGLDPDLVYEDWGLLLNLTRRLQIRLIPDRLFLYRQHGHNASNDPVRMWVAHRELCARYPQMAGARRLKLALQERDLRGVLAGLRLGNLDLALRFALRQMQRRRAMAAPAGGWSDLWRALLGRLIQSPLPPAVTLGPGARIGARVRLVADAGGRIEIGAGCVIAADAELIAGPGDLVLGEGCHIGTGARLVAGAGLSLGPGCLVEAGARIGAGGDGVTRIGRASLLGQGAEVLGGAILGALCAVAPAMVITGTHPDGAWLLHNDPAGERGGDPGGVGETLPAKA